MAEAVARAKKQPLELTLGDEAESAYLARASAALDAARLNNFFPDPRPLASHLRCLAPAVHGGLYPGLPLDVRSGLPAYRAWARLQADREVAGSSLAGLPPREVLVARARRSGATIHGKRLLKYDYFSALAGQPPVTLSALRIALRRVVPEKSTAEFSIVFDKLDLCGLWLRTTIELAQRDSFWNRRMVALTDDSAGQTEALRALVYAAAGNEAELIFAQLAATEGLQVERVIKGTIGPFFCAGVRVPAPLQPLVEDSAALIATFALERVAVDQATDGNNDPLAGSWSESLSPEARQTYLAARARWGYRVFKDRKLVAPPQLAAALTAFCRASGTRNLIYPLAG